MSVDPPPPSPKDPFTQILSLPDDPAAEQSETRRALRRFRRNDAAEGVVDDTDDDELLRLSKLLRRLVEKKLADPGEPEAKSPRASNRFVPRSAPPAEVGSTDLPTPQAPPMRLKPRTARGTGTGGRWQQNTAPFGKWLLYPALIAAVAAATYFLTRTPPPPGSDARSAHTASVAVPKLTTAWPSPMIAELDAALAADQAGDLKTAQALATELKKHLPDAPGLDLYLATLMTRLGQANDAENVSSKMVDAFTPPLEAAAANGNLGFIYARERDLARAAASFSDAAAADPFNPSYFEGWAEALRREGQLRQAVDRFAEALERLPAGVAETAGRREQVAFKLHLTQIEAGRDDDLKPALDAHLAEPRPTGYWLLTAAAYALQRGDMAAAADALQKARESLPVEVYAELTNDYFFHNFSGHKEVAALLPADTPQARQAPFVPRMGNFIDP